MIEKLLKDIDNLLLSIEQSCIDMGNIESKSLVSFQNIEKIINESDNIFSTIYVGFKNLNIAFLPLYFDIDLQISKQYIEQNLNSNSAQKFEIDYGDYKFTLTRLSAFISEFADNALQIQSKWSLFNPINGQLVEYFIRLSLRFYPLNSNIHTQIVRSPLFFNINLSEVNPFKSLPIAERFEIINKTNLTLKQSIEKFKFDLPAYQIDDQNISFLPKEFIFNNSLLVYSRTLNRARTRYLIELSRYNLGCDFVMGVRKEYMIPIISNIVSAKDASLTQINFQYGKIAIESYGSKSKSFLHISVKGKVWMRHNIFLSVDFGNLNYRARWSFWKYKIKSERCWPICGKVIDEAETEVMNIINSRKSFDGTINSSFGLNSKCRVTPEGITFYFNK